MNLAFRPIYSWALITVAVCAVISAAVSLQAGIFILLFAILAWWTWLNPQAAVAWLLVVSPILPLLKTTQLLDLATLSKDVLIIALCARTFVYPLVTKCLPYRRQIIWLPLAVVWVWVAMATVRADSLVLGIVRARELLLYSLLYLAVVYLPLSRQYLRELWGWMTASFIITTLLAVYQWFGAIDSAVLRFDPVRSIWIPRLSSTFGHPSVYGQYVITLAALFGATFVTTKNSTVRIFTALLALSTLPLIYLTYSRGVWLGFVVTIGVISVAVMWPYLVKHGITKLNRQVVVGTGLGLVVIVWLVIQFTSVGVFIRSAFDPKYESNRLRLEFMARLVAPMSNWDALVGRGLGDVTAQIFRTSDVTTFEIASGDSRSVQLAKDATLVDNQYLKTFVEMGLAGLLIYAWLLWRFIKGTWELWRTSSEPSGQILALTTVGFLAAFVVQAFFIDIWDIFPTNLVFWLLAGLVGALLTPRVLDVRN